MSLWRHQMETFSALLAICAGNSPVPGEFPAQRPVARSFDVFFDLRLNKRLSKQSWGWWFEMLSCPLWRHCNVMTMTHKSSTAMVLTGPSLVQIMACRLADAKPLSKPKLKWSNSYIFIHENACENVVWKIAAILSQPQYVSNHPGGTNELKQWIEDGPFWKKTKVHICCLDFSNAFDKVLHIRHQLTQLHWTWETGAIEFGQILLTMTFWCVYEITEGIRYAITEANALHSVDNLHIIICKIYVHCYTFGLLCFYIHERCYQPRAFWDIFTFCWQCKMKRPVR